MAVQASVKGSPRASRSLKFRDLTSVGSIAITDVLDDDASGLLDDGPGSPRSLF